MFFFISFCVFVVIVSLFYFGNPLAPYLALVFIPLFVLGLFDMVQTRHAVKRNFPVIGHFRYILEAIRPEIQQYFVESNTDGAPINRNDRSLVYQRSKQELQSQPFGTQQNVYEVGRDWVCHSIYPVKVDDHFDRVTFGGPHCKQPYSASRLNISAMSYGSLSKNAVSALNLGARLGGFAQNTGEGGISEFHRLGGDIIWQLGTGYFGARQANGMFCPETFKEKSHWPEIKMIELKLSQGAKPGKGGMLPGAKVTQEIATIRGVEIGKDVISPAGHPMFSDAKGLMNFIGQLRELSGGKPVGFKLCVGKHQEFFDIIEAMKQTGIQPDFITVDGSEGGTGAAPLEFANSVGMPIKDGLAFVSQTLEKENLKKDIRIIASGKSLTGFDMIRLFALGADTVNSARGMMLALGCIQALRCHSNHCPVGITTNNPQLVAGLHVPTKSERIANYHKETLKAVKDLLSAMGKTGPEKVGRSDIYQRQPDGSCQTFAQIYT
ncbi:MAG: FMN-binding glutamate synthase family protein [Bdellovibrionales bacterium]|nr:FMN-binding glutamate synthase family protein [Bdellovibrionales bacterium]